MEWINVNKQIPTVSCGRDKYGPLQSDNVLVTNGKGYAIANLSLTKHGDRFWTDVVNTKKTYVDITHWCELPELPEIKQEIVCYSCGKIWCGGDYVDCGWVKDSDKIYCCECKMNR